MGGTEGWVEWKEVVVLKLEGVGQGSKSFLERGDDQYVSINPGVGTGRAHLMSFLGPQKITLGAGRKLDNLPFCLF